MSSAAEKRCQVLNDAPENSLEYPYGTWGLQSLNRWHITMNYKNIILLVFLGLLLVWFVFRPSTNTTLIELDGTVVQAEIADTHEERIQGLSGREELAENHGMLSVFEREGTWGIWMKDMHFAIDILWLDEQGRIVTILRSIVPETYPKVFYPLAPARYVLELPAGFADVHGIAEGMQVVIH